MTDNIIHASETGFIVGGSPNVNAVYGPWRSVQEAQDVLESYFVTFDENWQSVPNVPVGTTVAVYNSDKQDLVTEYWWVKNNLVLKTYGNNYYELVVKDTFDRIVNSIVIKDGFIDPDRLKVSCIDNSTEEKVQFGQVNYSIDGGDFETYSFNSGGITTNNITTSIVFEWRDDEGRLILFKDLNVIVPATITQNFYAYSTELEQPEYSAGAESSDYQNSRWTPNVDILTSEDWVTKRRGVSREFPIEWVISRTRINGVWEPIEGPVISASFGKDGANATNQQYLWTYSIYNDQSDNLKSTIQELNEKTKQSAESYEVTDTEGNTIIWYSKFQSLTPQNRYCYITHRYKQEIDDAMVWSSWVDPAIYTVYPLDGKDTSTTEYIYCRSDSEQLSLDADLEFNTINAQYTTDETSGDLGGEIEFGELSYWTSDPKGISSEERFEFASIREIGVDETGITHYGSFSTPFIWAAFGKEGPDGPGVEYIYKLSNTKPEQVKAGGDDYQQSGHTPDGWSDDPLEVSYGNPILWMSQRKKVNGIWGDFTDPVIWNQFNLTYTLVLSNENCSIPSAADGSYTLEAARSATVTKVTLYLGSEDVTDQATIKATGYTKEGDNYYLADTSYDFTNATNINFIAEIDEEQVASKFQTVSLNKGAESYMLQCLPNNRIWYGGNSYSTTNFQLKLYKINAAGQYEEINDLSNFEYTYQFSNSNQITKADAHNNIAIQSGESSSIYLTLYSKNVVEEGKKQIIDSVTITCVDYSTIKGADNVSVLFGGIEKNIDIPSNKAQDVLYIKNRTKSIPKAYINTVEIPADKLEISAELIYLDAIIPNPIKINPVDGVFWFEQPLIGDASIIYTIKVTMEDNTVQEYIVSQILNLTTDKIVYDLYPDVNIITYGDAGFSSETINFTVVASEGDIPYYTIKYRINDIEGQIENNTETYQFNLSDNIKNGITEGTYTLFFELYVLGVLKDTTSVTIISEPRLAGYNYTIDLDNPHIQIPIGITGKLLQDWSTSQFTVYQADKPIYATGEEYPKYSIDVLDPNRDYVHIENDTVYLTTLPPSNTIINYTVTIQESENISYSFIKSQRIQLVNDAAYQLISNPNKIVTTHDGSGTITYTPIINKIVNGEVINITDLQNEQLEIAVGDAQGQQTLPIQLSYSSATTSLQISLKKKNGELLDSDTIPVIRSGAPGADGLSVKYVYGQSKDKYITEEQLKQYNNNGSVRKRITYYTKETFTDFTDYLEIQWYDDPKGINSTYQQEFQSLSTYNGLTWSHFSIPIIHSEIGQKGEDGDGVQYFYTACQSLGVVGEQYTIVSSTGSFTGSLAENQVDPIELPGWKDNIPDLSRDNPNLFMTLRKKVQGQWSPFQDPILWNTYHSELELVIDNNVIIIDDNSTAETVQQVSTTNIKAYYLGSEIDLTKQPFSYSISEELENIIDVTHDNDNNVYYITINDEQSLEPASGQITYRITYNGITVTAAQQVQIKDFSAGEVYKLVLSPNVLPLIFEDGKYKWDNTPISITALKISGKVSEDVTNSVTLKLNGSDISSQLSENNIYVLQSDTDSNTPQFIFDIVKDNIVVESQTLQGTLQGKDGQQGESGATFRLRGEWNSSTTYYYKGGENTGDSYIDVVFMIKNSKKSFYQAKQTGSNNEPTENSEYWEPAPSYDTLLSENILISDGDTISGGMLNKATNSKTILWAGGNGEDTNSSSANAAFRVAEDGTLYASKGMFSGMYISKARELQKFVVSKRIMPELVYYEEYETGKFRAVTPPILDISELSDVLIFDFSKFDFSGMPKLLRDSNGDTIKYPRYIYDDETKYFIREDVELYINGHPTVYLPTGWYVPIAPDTYNNIPYKRLHHFLSVGMDGSIHAETSSSEDLSFDCSYIEFDAFFAYMVSLTTSETQFTPGDIWLNTYSSESSFFQKVKEYWDYKYTEALAYKGKSFTLKFDQICGVTMPIIKSLMFETSGSINVGGNYVSPIEQLAFNKQSYDNQLVNTLKVLTCTSIPLEVANSNDNVLNGYLKEVLDYTGDGEYFYQNIVGRDDVNEELLAKTRQALAISSIGFTSMDKIEEKEGDYLDTDSPWGGWIRKQPFSDTSITTETIYYYEDGDIWWFNKNLQYTNSLNNTYYIPCQCCVAYPQDPSKNFSMPYINAPYRTSAEFITWNLTSVAGTDFQLRYTPVDEITVDCEFNQKK